MAHPALTTLRRRFLDDGVVHLPGVLNDDWMELVRTGIRRKAVAAFPGIASTLAPGPPLRSHRFPKVYPSHDG